VSVPDGATKVAWPQEARARSVLNVRSPPPENGGDGENDEMNRIFIVAREVISPWSALLSAPGAGEEEVPDLSKGVRPEYEPCHGTSHALEMAMACGRFSVRALRRFSIVSPFQIEEVPEHVFAPEVAAASDHSSVEINCENHPRLMTEGVEGPLRGRALIPSGSRRPSRLPASARGLALQLTIRPDPPGPSGRLTPALRLPRVSLNRPGALGSRKTLCALCLRLL